MFLKDLLEMLIIHMQYNMSLYAEADKKSNKQT